MKNKQKSLFISLDEFFKTESSGGVVMIACALLAIIAANSIFSGWYNAITLPITHTVNDVLMVFFFLLVGMELKREMLDGFLTDKKQIILPLFAAIGGMLIPAAIFMMVNNDSPANWKGWAIPCATDIAFAVCILLMAGKHIPPALKIFLLAIAIFDDLGAILIIAFFYSGKLAVIPLLLALAVIGLIFAINKLRVMAIQVYMLAGIFLCICLYYGGIHTTIGGVIVGMAIPLPILKRFIHILHPWVNFLILPLFAFTAAGINLHGVTTQAIFEPLAIGIAIGLIAGKQLGIFSATWIMVKSGFAKLPDGASWRQVYGVCVIAGIGFTMSLFIGALAFPGEYMQAQVKLGVIAGSIFSAVTGWLILRFSK